MSQEVKKSSGRHWPWIVVGLLVANACGVFILLFVASTDASHHVEADYYRKALDFDQTIAQRNRNRELGWRVDVRLGAAGAKSRLVQFAVADGRGQAIRGVSVEVVAFHKARASRRLKAAPVELAALPGHYEAHLPMLKEGIWEFRIILKKGENRFTSRKDLDSTTADPPVEPRK